MVAEDQVGVELYVRGWRGLHGGVGFHCWGCGGDLGEEGAGWEGDEGDGSGEVGAFYAFDVEDGGDFRALSLELGLSVGLGAVGGRCGVTVGAVLAVGLLAVGCHLDEVRGADSTYMYVVRFDILLQPVTIAA